MKLFIYRDLAKGDFCTFELLEENKLARILPKFCAPILFECEEESILHADVKFKAVTGISATQSNIGVTIKKI